MRLANKTAAGLLTTMVLSSATYAVWLGAPLLIPAADQLCALDIPIVRTAISLVSPPIAEGTPQVPAPAAAQPASPKNATSAPGLAARVSTSGSVRTSSGSSPAAVPAPDVAPAPGTGLAPDVAPAPEVVPAPKDGAPSEPAPVAEVPKPEDSKRTEHQASSSSEEQASSGHVEKGTHSVSEVEKDTEPTSASTASTTESK